jgi:hypothetical protein
MTDLTPKQKRALALQRRFWNVEREAQRRAWTETTRRVENVRLFIEDRNYGLAADAIRSLLEDLPHDYGAQDITPMLDRYRDAVDAATPEPDTRSGT